MHRNTMDRMEHVKRTNGRSISKEANDADNRQQNLPKVKEL